MLGSVAECSTAATIAISSTADVVTNPSTKDTTTIADENARLKTLLETGMYKSLKGIRHYVMSSTNIF